MTLSFTTPRRFSPAHKENQMESNTLRAPRQPWNKGKLVDQRHCQVKFGKLRDLTMLPTFLLRVPKGIIKLFDGHEVNDEPQQHEIDRRHQ
jgi:hypothetical protein